MTGYFIEQHTCTCIKPMCFNMGMISLFKNKSLFITICFSLLNHVLLDDKKYFMTV